MTQMTEIDRDDGKGQPQRPMHAKDGNYARLTPIMGSRSQQKFLPESYRADAFPTGLRDPPP
jgi:hypothetical protein